MSPWRRPPLSLTKAIFLPSADQVGDDLSPLPKVICFRLPPEGETVKIWAVPSASPLTTAILPFLPGKDARAGSCATTSTTHAASATAVSTSTTPTDGLGKPILVDLDAFTTLLLAWRSAREGGTVSRRTSLVTTAAYRGGGVGRLG